VKTIEKKKRKTIQVSSREKEEKQIDGEKKKRKKQVVSKNKLEQKERN
jgi:hypothetical protein